MTMRIFLLSLFVLSFFFIIHGRTESIGFYNPDSSQYLASAYSILSRELPHFLPPDPLTGLSIRPPLYPLLLAATIKIFGEHVSSILLLHLGIAIVSLGITVRILKNVLSPVIRMSLQGLFLLLLMNEYFFNLGVEWLVFNLFITWIASIAQWRRFAKKKYLFVAYFCTLLLALTRFEFLWLLAVPLIGSLPAIYQGSARRRFCLVFPLIFTCFILFCVRFSILPSDSRILVALSLHESTKTLPQSSSTTEFECLRIQYIEPKGQDLNVFELFTHMQSACSASAEETSFFIIQYGMQRVKEHFWEFVLLVWSRCFPLLSSIPLLFFFFTIRRRNNPFVNETLMYCALISLSTFSIHILIIAPLNVMDQRYYLPLAAATAYFLSLFCIEYFTFFHKSKNNDCLV